MSIRGDRERAEGMDVRGLVVDLHQNANPLERISVHLRGLAPPLYARLFDSSEACCIVGQKFGNDQCPSEGNTFG